MSMPSASPSSSARETLQRAIQIETRNAAIYNSFAQLFQGYDDSVTSIFREMADEEKQHEAQLLQRYGQLYHGAPPPAPEPKEVIEAPELDDPEAFIFDSMTIEEALETGLRAEEAAREFYRREAVRTSDPELRKIYGELGEFEEAHVTKLEQKLAEKRGGSDPTGR